jgi:hypothetical protein
MGIGRGLAASPLPHHRTYGSGIRRFGRFSRGGVYTPTGASSPGAPVASSSYRMLSHHSAAGNDSSLFISSRRTVRAFRGGIAPPRVRVGQEFPSPMLSMSRAGSSFGHADCIGCLCPPPTLPSADFSHRVRVDYSSLSHHDGPWETSRGKTQSFPRVDAGCIKYAPIADGGLCGHGPARPRHTTPHIRFLFVAPRVWMGLPSDPASRRRPCPSPSLRLRGHLARGLTPR